MKTKESHTFYIESAVYKKIVEAAKAKQRTISHVVNEALRRAFQTKENRKEN